MASIYTHNRFGKLILSHFPDAIRQLLENNRDLFILGQQGPDLFFFNPKTLMKSDSPGTVIHKQSGKQFLTNQKARLKQLDRTDPQLAYFIGVLCHYIVDVYIHPTVNALVEPGDFSHIAIETELDRYYIQKDGHPNPLAFRLDKLLTKNDAVYAQYIPPFYSMYNNGNKKIVMGGIRFFRRVKRLFFAPGTIKENVLLFILTLAGNDANYKGLVMRHHPLPQTEQAIPKLLPCIDNAFKNAVSLIDNALDYIYNDTPLLPFFNHNFDGEYSND